MRGWDFFARFLGPAEADDLDDLRREMILEIDAALFAIGWILALAAIGYRGRPEHLCAALILFAGSLGSIVLRPNHLVAALCWTVAAAVGAVACETWFFPSGPARYYFPIAVVVSSLLVSRASLFLVATLVAASCLAAARLRGLPSLDSQQVLAPVLLIYLTAFVTWLSSRQLRTALSWTQSSYERARNLLDELRDRRMWLARTLKALEEAYVRIERMNHALMEARNMAEEARRLKAEFAAHVSHELRTPLNVILGFSETMANAPETYKGVTWSPALRGDVEQIHRSSRHLLSLIDDILDLSALDARHLGLAIEETEVASVIAEAVAVVENLFRAKALYLIADTPPDLPRVQADAVRIRQVLINLLTNASRFTRQGGVRITSRLVGREVEVAVADTGVGIAAADVARVFEDFGQVDGPAPRRREGTGLGVPLSKRLVELHGGRMWLASRVGEGTTFFFTLPVSSRMSQAQVAPTRAPAPASPYRRNVLAVEPDPLTLRILRRHMSACDVIEVQRPEDLPALVEQHRPVGLVVDREGGAAAAAWPADVPADLPVITVSLPNALRNAQALGIDGVLIKPVAREQLLAAIAGLGRRVRDVLIVDDDPQLVDLFARLLQSAEQGYRPIRAFGGAEALARLRQQPVDLVLLDVLMPEVDGLAVLKETKADPTLAGIPIIVVSAHYPEAVQTEGGLFIQVARAQNAPLGETLNALAALVATLPLRGLPMAAGAPASPAAPGGLPAS